jgi:hypothetical protein
LWRTLDRVDGLPFEVEVAPGTVQFAKKADEVRTSPRKSVPRCRCGRTQGNISGLGEARPIRPRKGVKSPSCPVEGFQIPPGTVHPCQSVILGVPIDSLAAEDLLDEQLDPQHLQREHLAEDLLRGIGRTAEVGGDPIADVARVTTLLRSQVEHRKGEAFGKRADLAALLSLSEGERLVIRDTAARCWPSCGGNFVSSNNINVVSPVRLPGSIAQKTAMFKPILAARSSIPRPVPILRSRYSGRNRRKYGRQTAWARFPRRISIIALARKLLIALSRYVTHGEIPAGAVVKPV